MKRLRYATAAVSIALAATMFTGCTTSNQAGGQASGAPSAAASPAMQPTKKTGPLKIAFVPVVMNTSYQMVLNGIKAEIDKNGGASFASVTSQAPTSNTSSSQQQANIIETLIQQNYDAIFLATEDENAMLPYLKEASAKGIPVFLFNMAEVSDKDPYFVTNVSADQYQASVQIAQWAMDHFKGKKTDVAVLEGFPGVVNTQRVKGFTDTIKDDPDLHVVASQPADWTRSKGQTVTENIIEANPDVSFIYGLYDEMSLGAVAAVKSSGKKNIEIAGYDMTQDGYTAIKNGDLAASVDTGSKAMGQMLVASMKSFVVDGQEVPRSVPVPTKVYDSSSYTTFDVSNYS
jgi:ABC-type sugar transport system substrate-binding protein